jgi:RNA polymerase sigma-70 factor, ECF subfamily
MNTARAIDLACPFPQLDAATPNLGLAASAAMLPARSVAVPDATGEDEQLIAQVARGDARAYRVLADRYLSAILRYTTRVLGDAHDAEDATQETFLRLWQHANRYEPRAKLTTWLYRIAHNVCVDRLRKRRDHRDADDDALGLAARGDRPSGVLLHKELAAQVEDALAQLPERQRAAVVLVHYEGLTQEAAAQVLECSTEALESLLARGRRGLRAQLTALGIAPEGEPT